MDKERVILEILLVRLRCVCVCLCPVCGLVSCCPVLCCDVHVLSANGRAVVSACIVLSNC